MKNPFIFSLVKKNRKIICWPKVMKTKIHFDLIFFCFCVEINSLCKRKGVRITSFFRRKVVPSPPRWRWRAKRPSLSPKRPCPTLSGQYNLYAVYFIAFCHVFISVFYHVKMFLPYTFVDLSIIVKSNPILGMASLLGEVVKRNL